MINFAHRGASRYAPENTMAAFRLGVSMGADGIETDVQRTKDGVLVLFHDSTLERTLSVPGTIQDHTWKELLSLDAGSFKGDEFRGERLVSLEDFLAVYGHSGLKLAVEIKQEGIELEVLDMLRRHAAEDGFTITSFSETSIRRLASLGKERPQLGLLSRTFSLSLLDSLVSDGIVEYCPNASFLEAEMVREAHSRGLRVRAWGVKTPELMERMVDLDIYGMTVDFPDLLHKRLHGHIS